MRLSTRSLRGVTVPALLVSVLLVIAACSGSGEGASPDEAGSSTSVGTPQRGGTLVVLEDKGFAGDWSGGLDPANAGGGSISQYQAIFGGLFLLRADKDGSNTRLTPYQAASGTLSPDAKTLTIKLREGIEFSDGTPMNAKAVIWNFKRDTGATCTCAPDWELRKKNPFTSPDPLTVVVHLAEPNAAILNNFPTSGINWIASPTAFKKMGAEKFMITPVGAGPFTVVSNQLSSKLVLKRNPNFFKDGQPYLDKLIMKSIGGDQPAYQAMLAGEADAYEAMLSPPVIEQAKSRPELQVTVQPGTSPYLVHFNTMTAPFDNKKARAALYYATDWEAINKGLFGGEHTVVEGFTSPVDLYYHKETPGYRTYDLDKAKQLVKELGGLSFQLDTTATYVFKKIMTALQTQWEKAGMNVKIKAFQLSNFIKRYNSGKWDAALAHTGSWDPAVGVGINFRFSSTSPFTGVKDPHLDKLLDRAVATAVDDKRDKAYQDIAKYISDQAYGMFGFAVGPANVAVTGVHGPGLTTKIPPLMVNTGVIWSEVWTEHG